MAGTRSTPGGTSRRRPPARDRALEAGVRLWIETEPAQLYAGLNVSRIAKAAGITRATFYTYWGTTQEYLDELADHIANEEPSGFSPELTTAISRLVLGGDTIDRDYLDVCVAVIEHLAEDPALRLRLGMLAKLDDPVVAEKLRTQYRAADDRMSALYAPMLERWGRVPRPPLEQHHMTALHSALMEVFAARHRLDPISLPAEVYGWASVAWLLILTTTRDRSSRDLPSIGKMLNDFAADGDRVRAMERSLDQSRTPEARDWRVDATEIVRHARRMLVYRTWPEITVEQLSTQAGVRPEAIAGLFGSKHGLAVAVLQAIGLEALGELSAVEDPLQRVRSYLELGRRLLRRSPALTQSATLVFIGMAEGPAPGLGNGSVIAVLAEAIAAAQEHGQLSSTESSHDIAALMLRTLLTEFSQPYATDRDRLDAAELVLRGLGATADAGSSTAAGSPTVG